GKYLIEIARNAISTYINEKRVIAIPEDTPEKLKLARGTFVTINKVGTLTTGQKELRGCIGYVEPIKPLIEAVIDVAISAATNDPRFPQMDKSELDEIELELSVLTVPQLINVNSFEEYLEKIEIGRDGLIIEKGPYKGLLLPQVASEYNMNVEEFLANTCQKSGLNYSCWKDSDTEIYSFQAQIFNENE
ncbi:MAG: TIGR00296 family protein, partial [Methanobacteriaceae archaeon]